MHASLLEIGRWRPYHDAPMTNAQTCILIIGGGAAGFFAAIHSKETHPEADVVLLEKSDSLLSKVNLSGGGRCNVTHACFDPKLLVGYYPRGHRELLGPFHRFQPQDTMAWFTSHGVPLKTESDNRVFPRSDDAHDISGCLIRTARELGVRVMTQSTVTEIQKVTDGFDVQVQRTEACAVLSCQKVILATGSSRGGYAYAAALGHTIVPPIPSLFTFKIADPALHELTGLAVTHAKVFLADFPKRSQTGPVLITHWGLSGPAVIRLSAWEAESLHTQQYGMPLVVNWLPMYTADAHLARISQMVSRHPGMSVGTQSVFSELPQRLWRYLMQRTFGASMPTWKQLSTQQRHALCQTLSHTTYQITGKGSFKDEFVTCGGVSLKEIDFKTMESRCCPGLHVVGEALNVDGVTGGFNFQNAWTTGYLAGVSVMRR